MHTRRVLPAAPAADARRVHAPAGSIASRNGRATVTPMPFRTVRREMCFIVMCMSPLPLLLRIRGGHHGLGLAHLERGAVHDPDDERREAIVVLRRLLHNRANGR